MAGTGRRQQKALTKLRTCSARGDRRPEGRLRWTGAEARRGGSERPRSC